jgi:hypothetical protein
MRKRHGRIARRAHLPCLEAVAAPNCRAARTRRMARGFPVNLAMLGFPPFAAG